MNQSRALARLVVIEAVTKHPNADRLQVATIGGWQVVVNLEVQTGDRGVYFEIDSILPATMTWATGITSGPIRSLKIRGVLSQGLFLPFSSVFPEEDPASFEIDQDLTDRLQVTKRTDTADVGDTSTTSYEQAFPLGPPKTDEIRLQSRTAFLTELAGNPYYITIKYDGSSATFGLTPQGRLVVASRNYALAESPTNVWWSVARRLALEEKLQAYPGLVLQGEIYGPKIQHNYLAASEPHLAIFNIYDTVTKRYLDLPDVQAITTQLGLTMVDLLEVGDNFQYDLPTLLELADGKYPNTQNAREGLVIRPQREMTTSKGSRLSFKVISNQYLLKTKQ